MLTRGFYATGGYTLMRSGGGPQIIVWPADGNTSTASADPDSVGDKVTAGRGYLLFAKNDNKGYVAAVDSDGNVTGPTPFASAGNQFGGEPLGRYGPTGASDPAGGLWIAFQDNRSGSWQVYFRKVN